MNNPFDKYVPTPTPVSRAEGVYEAVCRASIWLEKGFEVDINTANVVISASMIYEREE